MTGLRVHAHHGVYESERRTGQDFLIDVTLHLDTSAAAKSDDVADTVHYGALAEALVRLVSAMRVNLLETLAERIAAECLRDGRVDRCEVTVHKPQAPIPYQFTDVAVTVVRRRT
ncbi:dihydroneopterin aldolase [Stackebrandtia albiflava]